MGVGGTSGAVGAGREMGVHRLFCGSHRAHLGPALGATAALCLRAAVPCCSPHTLSLPLGSCRTCFLLFQSKIWGCSPSHPAVGSPPHQGPLGPGVSSTQSPPVVGLRSLPRRWNSSRPPSRSSRWCRPSMWKPRTALTCSIKATKASGTPERPQVLLPSFLALLPKITWG